MIRALLPLAFLLIAATASAADDRSGPPVVEDEAPRVRALLAQGWAAESGDGQFENDFLAAALYCEAARLGSGEGYFRTGLIYARGRRFPRDLAVARVLFAQAAQLGHREAAGFLDESATIDAEVPPCLAADDAYRHTDGFDLDRYLAHVAGHRGRVVALVRRLAPRYDVDVRLALALISVESDFDPDARSAKNAAGVMQLIPETADRFGVRNPFDAEQNIRGGLAYLRWLLRYFQGDVVRVVAAYNAGEQAVERYGGIPPYYETQSYVWRVLNNAGPRYRELLPATTPTPRTPASRRRRSPPFASAEWNLCQDPSQGA